MAAFFLRTALCGLCGLFPFTEAMRYWLIKSEPPRTASTISSATRRPHGRGAQLPGTQLHARQMKPGDRALYYHSNCDEPGIVASPKSRAPPTPTRLSSTARRRYYDGTSTRVGAALGPRRLQVREEDPPDNARRAAHARGARHMRVLARGNRLSITPVVPADGNTYSAALGLAAAGLR